MVSLLEDIIRCIPASISEKTDVRSVFTGAYLCARAVRGSGFSDSRLVVLRQNPQFQLKKRQTITIHTKAIFVFSGYLLQCNHLPPMHPWPLISTEGVVPQGVSGKGIIYWLSQSSMVFRLFFGPLKKPRITAVKTSEITILIPDPLPGSLYQNQLLHHDQAPRCLPQSPPRWLT